MNLIRDTLVGLGVTLPDQPLDLSHCLEDAGVKHSYVIVMTGRSGSTWLASALKSVPGAGDPHEYFSEEALPHYGNSGQGQGLAAFTTELLRRRKTGATFGFKINPRRLKWLSTIIDLPATFDPLKTAWIDMRRLNVVKQAFSFARARQSGQWHKFAGAEGESPRPVAIDDGDIWQNLASILGQERDIDRFYRQNAIRPLKVLYEEIYDSKPDVLMRVLHEIDPARDWPDIADIHGSTLKLASDTDAAEELAFLKRHTAQIARMMRDRDTIRLDELTGRPADGRLLPIM